MNHDPGFITPARARVVRVLIDSERADALRAGEPDPRWQSPATDPVHPAGLDPTPPFGSPCRVCGSTPTRRYMNAHLCVDHKPDVPRPDPARTMAALMRRRELLIKMRRAELAAS